MPKRLITRIEEELVKKLYNQGMTGPEVAKKLNISDKQVYGALRRKQVPRKTACEQNKKHFENKPLSFHFKKELIARERELMVAAVMLYYGEGAKTGVTVDLANSDTLVVKLFLKFLRKICRVDESRLRCYLYCFSDQNSDSLIKYWSSQLGVEKKQFTKPYVRSTSNRGNRTMPHGVIHIRYSDKKLLNKILSLCSDMISSL